MSNIAKLKKKAAELEAKKQYEKALEVYEQALSSARAADEDRDVPLYNRVGDLHYRIGNNEQAISYYEQAADLYAEGGFFNNAIALCNKILRYSPGRTIIYYKLGIISAKKGFNSDAKQNFLEYADRMQRLGKMDEAFRALKEFADLCPGEDDVRLMLAEQLTRANRKEEALEQLELLYDMLQTDGRAGEATAALERIKALDPGFKPRRSLTPRASKKDGLVFLDLDFDKAPAAGHAAGVADDAPLVDESRVQASAQHNDQDPESASNSAPEGLELTSLSDEPLASVQRVAPFADDGPAPNQNNELRFITPADEATPSGQLLETLDLAPLVDVPGETSAGNDYPDSISVGGPLSGLDVISEGPPAIAVSEGSAAIAPDDDFIDLGEWLERTRTPVSTRMVTHDEEPVNDEQKDFGEMLDKFKAGISRNVDEEDFESHYDLGIAFREMGLLDEAIGSFQKASRGKDQRVRASEAIGQCFMDKGEAGVTMTVLERLVNQSDLSDSRLVGVLYLLGRAAESLGRSADAAVYFQRVLAVQIGFRDAADRLTSLAQAQR